MQDGKTQWHACDASASPLSTAVTVVGSSDYFRCKAEKPSAYYLRGYQLGNCHDGGISKDFVSGSNAKSS